MEEPDSALEQFRRQWREEVSARSKPKDSKHPLHGQPETLKTGPDVPRPSRPSIRPPTAHPATRQKDEDEIESVDEDHRPSMIERIEGLSLQGVDDDEFTARRSSKEPRSALEHYERAVEKESQGNLGASLSHYRQAYRLNDRVDQIYKSKHFPAKSKTANPNPSNAPATVPATAHHSSKEPNLGISALELVASFAGLPILGAPPLIEGDRPPPCPISKLPSEVLLEILLQTAIRDPASFVRLGAVCKALAYHVCRENQIWKRVALGAEFGLASQIYDFSTNLQGCEFIDRPLGSALDRYPITEDSFSDPQHQDWREVFHSYPRIRFTGVYISTVNYTRPGGASASQATWNSPVHIVTYYRYLRFFRDGTVISLLTTNEPIEVVQHLTKENVNLVRSNTKEHHPLNFTSNAPALGAASTQNAPPTAHNLMKHALRGRWRLCYPSRDGGDGINGTAAEVPVPMTAADEEGDLHIETEGAGPRYMYMMHLSLKSSSRSKHSVKNNKLQWKGFWSYNQLTNDWAEFQLKNDKAFFFSRVRSYGLGY
jgi:F-box protein 9